MKTVRALNISRYFGEVKALDDISFEVSKGELFGIIGPDGAGKSTLFDILVTLSYADSGEAFVDRFNVRNDAQNIREMIGYMPGKFSLYQDLTVRENLDFFATIFDTTVERSIELIADIWSQIAPFSDRPAGKLSGGMKQKLALCCALVHKPSVLFLDEPTTGVDPVSRREFWAMLRTLKSKGITMIISTPYMDEAILCDRVALMQAGKMLSIDSPQNITESYPHPLYEVESQYIYQSILQLRKSCLVHSCYPFGRSAHLALKQNANIEEVMQHIEAIATPTKATIEDCFIDLLKENESDRG